MSLFAISLIVGTLVSGFLVLHHLAAIKEDGDALLAAYRRVLAAARSRHGAAPAQNDSGADRATGEN